MVTKMNVGVINKDTVLDLIDGAIENGRSYQALRYNVERLGDVTIGGYDPSELVLIATELKKMGVSPEDAHTFAVNMQSAYETIRKENEDAIRREIEKLKKVSG